MLTDNQIKEDAKKLIEDLLLDLQIKELTLQDEKDVLLEAAKIMATASRVLAKMISDKAKPTMH